MYLAKGESMYLAKGDIYTHTYTLDMSNIDHNMLWGEEILKQNR